MMIARFVFGIVLALSTAALAVEPDEMLTDARLEARARDVSQALRCVVCQNETIDDSHAELARDMRLLVRSRIAAGDSNEQVLAYMRARYGDFVLLKPRFTPLTGLLWLGPFVLLILGGVVVRRAVKRPRPVVAPLSTEEAAALAVLNETTERP